jgi:ammonia channel protein AmtB
VVTLAIVFVLNKVLKGGVRVDAEEEESGLDLNEHSETAYAYDRV